VNARILAWSNAPPAFCNIINSNSIRPSLRLNFLFTQMGASRQIQFVLRPAFENEQL